ELAAIALLLLTAQATAAFQRSLHTDRLGDRLAGGWLHQHLPADAPLLDPGGVAVFFSERPQKNRLPNALLSNTELTRALTSLGPQVFLVLRDSDARRLGIDSATGKADPGFTYETLASFPDSPGAVTRVLILLARQRSSLRYDP